MIIYWLGFIASHIKINPFLQTSCIFVISLTLSILLTITVRKLRLGVIIGEKPVNYK